VIHRATQATSCYEGLRWPIVVKPNIGVAAPGSSVSIIQPSLLPRLRNPPVRRRALPLGMDSTALVQEFIPARDAHIVRVEVLNGRFIYAIKVHITGETFDLCPADICRTTSGVELNRAACAVDAPKSGLRVEGFQPPREVIADVERIMQHAGIEIGGVEYITDDRDGQRLYYDINALSNFVADGVNVVGFDPFAKLADWLEEEAARYRSCARVYAWVIARCALASGCLSSVAGCATSKTRTWPRRGSTCATSRSHAEALGYDLSLNRRVKSQ